MKQVAAEEADLEAPATLMATMEAVSAALNQKVVWVL